MIRKAYIKPESLLIPFGTENLMVIGGSAGTDDVFGKQTDFEEESDGDSWEDEMVFPQNSHKASFD